jgi:hypothetical protein
MKTILIVETGEYSDFEYEVFTLPAGVTKEQLEKEWHDWWLANRVGTQQGVGKEYEWTQYLAQFEGNYVHDFRDYLKLVRKMTIPECVDVSDYFIPADGADLDRHKAICGCGDTA